MSSLPDRPRQTRRPRYAAGVELPRDLDLRTIGGRKFKRLVKAYSREFGDLSDSGKEAMVRAVALEVRIEALQGREGAEDMLIRLCSEHRRVINGLRGHAATKPAAPTSLAELLEREEDGVPA